MTTTSQRRVVDQFTVEVYQAPTANWRLQSCGRYHVLADGTIEYTFERIPSEFEYTEPWYFGVSHGMAYVQMFRRRDRIWFAQSPTGGGSANPAWDFQWFVPDYKVGTAYGFVMRAAYLPLESTDEIERVTRSHRQALNPTLSEDR